MAAPATTLFLLTGNDRPTLRAEARKVITRLAGAEPDPFRCAFFTEGDDRGPLPVLLDVIDALQTPPFLGDSKIVWLQDFSAFDVEVEKIKDSHSPEQKALATLASLIAAGLPDDLLVVLDGLDVKPDFPLMTACAAKGKVQVFTLPDLSKGNWQAAVTQLVRQAAADRKMRLDEAMLAYLLDVLGVDTGRIPQELDKILCFAGAEPTLEQVMEICTGSRDAGLYALQDFINKRDLAGCLRTVSQSMYHARNPGSEAIRLVRQLGRHTRELLHARLLMHHLKTENPRAIGDQIRRLNQAERARFAGNVVIGLPPFRADKIFAGAAHYQGPELVRALAAIAVADRTLVSSSLDGRTVLETVLTRLVQRPA